MEANGDGAKLSYDVSASDRLEAYLHGGDPAPMFSAVVFWAYLHFEFPEGLLRPTQVAELSGWVAQLRPRQGGRAVVHAPVTTKAARKHFDEDPHYWYNRRLSAVPSQIAEGEAHPSFARVVNCLRSVAMNLCTRKIGEAYLMGTLSSPGDPGRVVMYRGSIDSHESLKGILVYKLDKQRRQMDIEVVCGEGYGERMMRMAIAIAKRIGIERIKLEAAVQELMPYYARFGFERIASSDKSH